jgi:hypothetical protein
LQDPGQVFMENMDDLPKYHQINGPKCPSKSLRQPLRFILLLWNPLYCENKYGIPYIECIKPSCAPRRVWSGLWRWDLKASSSVSQGHTKKKCRFIWGSGGWFKSILPKCLTCKAANDSSWSNANDRKLYKWKRTR